MATDTRGPRRTRVLYIVGPWRCGTTVLGNLLGATPGLFCAGEVISFWSRMTVPEWLCGCGDPLRVCPVWTPAIERSERPEYGGSRSGPETAAAIVDAIRSRRFPLLLTRSGRRRLFPTWLEERVRCVYDALGEVAGERVIVDTSKIPSYGRLLQTIPGLDVSILHVVRDPRAVAFSWGRRKRHASNDGRGDLFELPRIGPLKSSVTWLAANVETELLWGRSRANIRRLRYEDFIADPAGAIRGILDQLNLPAAKLPVSGRHATLGINHSAAGNPNRHAGRTVELREDRAWLDTMNGSDRAFVSGLTAPLLLRYGYRIGA